MALMVGGQDGSSVAISVQQELDVNREEGESNLFSPNIQTIIVVLHLNEFALS